MALYLIDMYVKRGVTFQALEKEQTCPPPLHVWNREVGEIKLNSEDWRSRCVLSAEIMFQSKVNVQYMT